MTDGLKGMHREAIIAAIAANDRVERAVLFGSRAMGTYTVSSDVDIALFGKRLTLTDHAHLAAVMDELPMAQQVDLLRFQTIENPALCQHIERHGVEWYRKPQATIVKTTLSMQSLQDVADIVMGQSPVGVTCNRDGEGLPLLNGPTEFGLSYPSPTQSTTNPKKRSRVGDLLFCVRGSTTGRMNWAEQEYAIGRGIAAIRHRTNSKLQPLVRAAVEYYLPTLLQSATGSVFPNVSGTQLAQIPYPILSTGEAENVAFTLGTLDDKIEVNRRMNATLEGMARSIFKDWFVDFGPTRAKMAGRKPYYLDPEIWDLFPNNLDDEDKPRGWEWGSLATVAASQRRSVSPTNVDENTPYIGLEHMPRRSITLAEWEGAEKVASNKSVFRKGEFLFGKLRPYFHKVGVAALDGICSTDIVVVVPRAPEWAVFILACLSSDEFVDYTDQTSTGTKMPRTSWKTMKQYKICIPSKELVHIFQNLAQPLIDCINTNVHESRTLAQTRDLLLPKLMSGEISVSAAEKTVEAIA